MKSYGVSAYDETTGKGCVRHILIRYGEKTGEWMVCFVINGKKLPHAESFIEVLKDLPGMTSITVNVNRAKTNVIMGDKIKLLWGQTFITDYIGNVKYQISPLSFYQVNPVQTELLYNKAMEYANLTGEEVVVDAYCGTGTIGIVASDHAKQVIGVELNKAAAKDAITNVKRNDCKNVRIYDGDAGKFMVGKAEAGTEEEVVY